MNGEHHDRRPAHQVDEAAALVGTRFGHIRIDRLIGSGGMGSVYAAYDTVLQRHIAVKVLHAQQIDDSARVRFLREARLLSQLQHPNICQIHDYTTDKGADLLVLELIQGKNLREAMADGLAYSEKLRIAAQLLDALIAAHDHGVVHRDLKPENVMITPQGVVKVLDFGIARVVRDPDAGNPVEPAVTGVLEDTVIQDVAQTLCLSDAETVTERLSPAELQTRHGAILGTPRYMSPEQAAGAEATPASDVYSCGLVLQELFTGMPPYDPSLTGARLVIKVFQGQTAPVVGLEPSLSSLIERMKALAPGSRPSAQDAADRLAWVRDRPRRRARRLALAAAMVLLVAVTAVTTYQAFRIGQEAERASREAEVASQVSGFLEGLFQVSDPSEARGNTVTAREILDRGAERINRELADQPQTRARLMLTMGRVYRELGLYDRADQLLLAALETNRAESDHLETATTLVNIGRLRELQGRYDEAITVLEQALTIRRHYLDEDDYLIGDALHRLANPYYQKARYDEAIPLYQRALEIFRHTESAPPGTVGRSLNNLANVYQRQGRYDEAIPLYREALAIFEEQYGADHANVGHPLNNLGMVYTRMGRYSEAIPLFERSYAIWSASLGATHPMTAHPLNNLADAYRQLGRAEEALPLYETVLEIREQTLGVDHPDFALALHGKALALRELGRTAVALPLFVRALSIRDAAFGPQHPDTLSTVREYVRTLRSLGRSNEATQLEQRYSSGLGDSAEPS